MEQSTVEICNACSESDLDLVKRLITRGMSSWVRDDQGNTLFHLCCSSYHCGLDILQYLITTSEIVSCIYLRNNEGSTPLHLACGAGKKEFVEFLIHDQYNNHNDFGLPNYQGETPLYFASRNGHSNIVSLICTNPNYILDPDDIYQCIKVAPNWDIMTILLRVISFKDFMTKVRQEKHAKQIFKNSVTIQLKDSSSPFFHQVAISGDLDIVQYLVNEVGCDVNCLDNEAYTPLHRAIEYGHLPIVQYLLSQPQCNCETRSNNCGMYPLHHAAGYGYLEVVKALVARDCDINIKNENELTPLHYSCGGGHLLVVKYLTSHPQCNIHGMDKWERTPLHAAAECGQLDIAKFLTEERNVDINLVGHYRETPLYMACWHGNLSLVEYFTSQSHCNINLKDQYGRHPLHVAACRGHLEIAKHLVDSTNCDINVSDDKGYTPIHNACNNGHLAVVEYLASKPQCNLEVLDNTGRQPLHYALCQGHKEVVMFLREKVCVDGIHQCIKSAVEDKVPGSMIELLVRKIGIKEYLTRRLEEDQPTFSSNDTILRDIIADDYPLHKSIELSCLDITKYLVNIGVFDINLHYYTYTPLHRACEKGYFEIVKILTNHPQCNIEAENNYKQRPLHKACQSGNVDIVRHLVVEQGCDVTAKYDYSYTPLHIACEKGHFEIVKILTDHPQCNIEAENIIQERPVYLACTSGSIDIVRHLVEDKGCDVNVKIGIDYNTLLHIACEKGNFEMVRILTDHPQCNIEAENNYKQRPLHKACQSGNVDIVRHLVVEKGCDVTAKAIYSDTPLHIACEKGHFEIVKILTDHPQCNIEAKNIIQERPVYLACTSGSIDIVRHLVEDKGCDVNVKIGIDYNTLLHIECEKGNFEMVRILTDHPQCNIEAENNYKQRPLHKACQSGNVDIVRHLVVEKGCDVTAKDDYSDTPLHIACEKDHFEIVKILTDHPQCNIEAKNIIQERPVYLACTSGSIDIVRHLVEDKGCDVNVKIGIDYNTLLHIECEKGNFEMVKILTDHPQCNIEAENNYKQRPLHKACQSGNVDIVRHLVVEKGCDVTAKYDYSDTPLHIACEKGHFEIVKILTDHPQCNIEAENIIQERPVYLACTSGSIDIVRHLVEDKGCDVNVKIGFDDNTLLHIACEKGNLEMVKVLTAHPQCNIEAENNYVERPVYLACKSGSVDIVRHLIDKGCVINGFDDTMYGHSRKKNEILSIFKYQQALGTSGEAMLCVVKCILTGPPGAGKSTLKKRLLNESLTEPSLSTGVVDAAIQVDSFRKLQQHNAVVTTEWRTQNLDEEAVLIFENILTSTSKSQCPPTSSEIIQLSNNVSSDIVIPMTEINETDIDMRDVLEEELEDSSGCNSDNETNTTEGEEGTNEIRGLDKKMEEGEIEEVNERFKQNNKTTITHREGLKSLSNFLDNIPVTKRKHYEKRSQQTAKDRHAMLHIIDTGGQPEFHEMLPALITGPAINLLVFDLTIDLTSRYEITYRSSSGDSKPYHTSLTHEEVIFRSLASIACLRQNTIGWSFDEVPLKDESEPAAFLIATHRDCFPNETEAHAKVDSVNNHLKLKIQDSGELFSEDLVQYSTPDQVIFALDTRNDEKEIEELRSILHQVIDRKFHELPVPASWCAFSLKLRKSKKPIHLLDTCYKMAQECGIKDREDFKSVLWFLHHRVGVIMYYPEVEGLGNIVITDLQLVFDRITQLITSCFTFKELGSASSEKEFRDNGRFSESHVKQLSSRKGDPLTPTRLVSLLKHLHIIAGPMKIKVSHKTENYYFMPCALKPAPVEEDQRDQSICPAPLTIYFECGYTPVGVFCCLVVYLLSQTSKSELEWKLHDKIVHHRNKITFKVGKYHDRIILISRATYLEVWVDQITPKLSLDVLCKQIISILHRGLETVTQSLHYTYKSRHFFGFPCFYPECHLYSSHPAIVDENDLAAECVLTREVMYLQERRHLVWSTKISELTTTSVSSEVLCTQSQESSYVTEVNDSMNEVILTDTLDIKDLKFVKSLLSNFTDWESLGLELGLYYPTLEAIKIEEKERVKQCTMKMLVAWLKKTDNVSCCHGPCWQQLIESLRAIEESSLADDIERRLLNKRSCDQSSSTPPSSKRSTNRDEVNDESSSRESSISSQRQDRRQHKRQRTDEEDNSDYDDNITTSITKRPPPWSHDQSAKPYGKEPAGGRSYKRKGRPDNDTDPNTKRRC